MARAQKMYRRLPGNAAALASYHRLWLGPDHLLAVRSVGFSEEYKRFYFSDIQALIVQKTDRREILNVICALAAILFGLLTLAISNPVWNGFWIILTALAVFLLLVNWLRGPTCVCHVRTAVQTEPLPSLRRARTAGRVTALLKPLIEQAQGALRPDWLQPRPPSAPAANATMLSTPPVIDDGQPPSTLRSP